MPPANRQVPFWCLIVGVIHMILQFVVTYLFADRFRILEEVVKLGAYSELEVNFREMYLAIAEFSAYNAIVALTFYSGIWICSKEAYELVCPACFLTGMILNFIITGLYWEIMPSGREDDMLAIRSIIFNSSVVTALIYYVWSFVFYCFMLAEKKKSGSISMDAAPPVEITPSQNSTRRVSPATANPPKVTTPSIQRNSQ